MKTLENIITKCVKGQFLTIVAKTSVSDMNDKQYKKSPYLGLVTKITKYRAVRFCEYENLTSVKKKRELGIEATSPTWWEWVKYPFIARHKTKGTLYVVVKPINIVPQSVYYLDGERIDTDIIKPYLKKVSQQENTVFMLKLDNITFLQQGKIVYINNKNMFE